MLRECCRQWTRSTPEIEVAGNSKWYSTQTESDFKNQFKQFGSNTHSFKRRNHISKCSQPLSPVWNSFIVSWPEGHAWLIGTSSLFLCLAVVILCSEKQICCIIFTPAKCPSTYVYYFIWSNQTQVVMKTYYFPPRSAMDKIANAHTMHRYSYEKRPSKEFIDHTKLRNTRYGLYSATLKQECILWYLV